MDADQAAMVFVEICTRLDHLVEAQRKTNELLAGLQSALREHLEPPAEDAADAFVGSRQSRGLGHLIPYGDDNVHPIVAAAPGSNHLATSGG